MRNFWKGNPWAQWTFEYERVISLQASDSAGSDFKQGVRKI